jgi:asparaginyl-tRNA synthetase
MVEPEVAFCDLEGDILLAVDFLKYVFTHVLVTCQEDMSFFTRFIDPTAIQTLENMISHEFQSITYTEAVKILTKADKEFEFPIKWGNDLQTEHEKFLCENVFKGPVIIVDYPKDIKPFYMKLNEDGKTVKAMDILVPKIGEVIGGSQREDDYNTLIRRMEEANLSPDDYSWYLDLRRFGSAPHSGFGLGFDRLIQFMTGLPNIRDVIPFPRTPKSLSF